MGHALSVAATMPGFIRTNDGTSLFYRDWGTGKTVVPLRLRTDAGLLSFFSTTTVFGTAVDITLSELAIEAFFPADAATAETLRRTLPP